MTEDQTASPMPRIIFAEPEPEPQCLGDECPQMAAMRAELATARRHIDHLTAVGLRARSQAKR